MNAEQAGSKRPIVCCPCRFGVCWNPTKAFFNWEHVAWAAGGIGVGLEGFASMALGKGVCNTVTLLYYMLLLEAMFFLE